MPECIRKCSRRLHAPIRDTWWLTVTIRYTRSAVAKFEEHFGAGIDVFFTFNGTGANVLGLQALNRSYHAVLCSDYAHIYTDECGAPEKHTGCKLIPLPHQDGKITLDSVRHAYHGIGDQHHVQVRVISITQSTEMGTVYQPEEIQALARFRARARNVSARGRRTHRQCRRQPGANAAAGYARPGRGRALVRRHEEWNHGRRSGRLLQSQKLSHGFSLPAQARDATRVEDALHRGAIRGAADERSVAAQRRARQSHGARARSRGAEDSAGS